MATAISIVLIITALFMIVTVLLQSSDEDGMGALTGSSNSYFSKSKSKTIEAKLALGTKIAAGLFVALSILLLIVK
jgi:preprotein translocase subunit SecG